MKRLIISFAVLAGLFGVASYYYLSQPSVQSLAAVPTPVAVETPPPVTIVESSKPKPIQMLKPKVPGDYAPANKGSFPPPPTSAEGMAFSDAVDTLVSPKSTYAQRQAAFKQLKDSGRLADAVAELKQRMANDPTNALYPASIGQAELKLCSTTTDVRQQAIWAMDADQQFDSALSLDPSNWDARFTKAVAMS